MMQFNKATNAQLFTIAYYEVADLATKYKAVKELQKRDKRAYSLAQHRITRKMA